MEGKARIIDVKLGAKPVITFELDNFCAEEIDGLLWADLRLEFVKWRDKRSLDSNAYAWALMQKIAEKIHSDKWTVYLEMLKRYSGAFTHIFVRTEAVPAVMDMYRASIDLGEITMNGCAGHELQVYFGSSSFNSKEMATFIDGIVSECEALGIQTKSAEELERMVKAWGV